MTHGGARPGSGAKPKGPAGRNCTFLLYKSNRDMIARWRQRYGLDSDAAAVRHMIFVASMAIEQFAGNSEIALKSY